MYELIEHKKLDAAAASITFSNIPQIYTDLHVVLSARSDRSGELVDVLELKLNGDVNNRTSRRLMGDGVNVQSNSFTNGRIGLVNAATSTVDSFASTSIHIPNYTSSSPKSASIDNVSSNNGTNSWQEIFSFLWNSSSPVSTVELIPNLGTVWLQNSSATLYGINRTQAIGKPKAVGGNITYANGYWVHTFTGSGTFYAQEDLEVDALVVAGGGGGGGSQNTQGGGGGGGAGGYLYQSGFSVSAKESCPVLVGAGGVAGATSPAGNGANGFSSAFSIISSTGGGGGAKGTATTTGLTGGSGGGGGYGDSGGGAGGSGTNGEGFNGQAGNVGPLSVGGGGGGGAGEAGGTDGATYGGDGAVSSITGASVTRAGGGGGGVYSSSLDNSGEGGGGRGVNANGGPGSTAGTPNTGGGGGGGYSTVVASAGGSGVVIVRYKAD